ncbi:sugar phosphate isomerase/epimerase family protein [Oceanotoga teriensis]|uniref:sugar phosphate isomerase/epimerase family protein n=1 Tax=Oceanotoga teriensis TaxID=515440 RepID=UPI0027138031|nr:sugar phosphate isomerase/epimerase [Oceanotoga teriensis]MDO7976910.1 sugar phosphate isomerase/epimerase [Oceanotoga teriensis]
MNIPISVQLYTLREFNKNDFLGTLKKVSSLGYDGVEFDGYYDLSAEDLSDNLKRLNLKPFGSHVSFENLKNNLKYEIDFNKKIGNKNIICPWAKFDSIDDWASFCKDLNFIGKKLKENGLQLFYHNHDHEFNTIDGKYIFDFIYENTDENLVKAEIDTFWVYKANVDPLKLMNKYKNRCSLIHIKDMKNDSKKSFEAIGEGIIDIESIIKYAKDIDIETLIVENDDPKPDGLKNISISIKNLSKMAILKE